MSSIDGSRDHGHSTQGVRREISYRRQPVGQEPGGTATVSR
jgi:hypothetical protein